MWERGRERDPRLADILLLAGWTGLRWSELRARRVRDFVEVPMPLLVVQRAEPEGVTTKVTKSGKSRRVPVADRVLSIVRALAANRQPDDLLCVTSTGHKLHATAFKRTLAWPQIAESRRIHDLRHTAACLWLARGVNPATVQAWMGHASIATTNPVPASPRHVGRSDRSQPAEQLRHPADDRHRCSAGHTGPLGTATEFGGAQEVHAEESRRCNLLRFRAFELVKARSGWWS